MEALLKLLNVEALNEDKQTEVKEKLSTIIEAKVSEKVEEQVSEKEDTLKEEYSTKLKEAKDSLTEEYVEKFNDFKTDVSEKFSSFVDSVLEEEMKIPEKIVRYANLGELYEPIIDQMKLRMAIDEGAINEEVKGLLKEAKEKINEVKSELDKTISEKIETEADAKTLATELFLYKKCDGLAENVKTKVMKVFEGASREDIENKFDIIVETFTEKPLEEDKEEINGKGKEVITESVEGNTEPEQVNESDFSKRMDEWIATMKKL